MVFKEKRHRLPREYYRGETSVAFTLCIKNRKQVFTSQEAVDIFIHHLHDVIRDSDCIIPAYCFMPDHQHLVLTGTTESADLWKTITRYKQKTGYWMSMNRPDIEWQKDFYDHVIKQREDLSNQVIYVLNNPVRGGLVQEWRQYPFKGSVGCDWDHMLAGII